MRKPKANLSPQGSCRTNCGASWDILVCPGYSCSWAVCPDVKIPGTWYPGGPSQVWQVKTEWLVQLEFQINNWYILKDKFAFYLKLKLSGHLVFIAALLLVFSSSMIMASPRAFHFHTHKLDVSAKLQRDMETKPSKGHQWSLGLGVGKGTLQVGKFCHLRFLPCSIFFLPCCILGER